MRFELLIALVVVRESVWDRLLDHVLHLHELFVPLLVKGCGGSRLLGLPY